MRPVTATAGITGVPLADAVMACTFRDPLADTPTGWEASRAYGPMALRRASHWRPSTTAPATDVIPPSTIHPVRPQPPPRDSPAGGSADGGGDASGTADAAEDAGSLEAGRDDATAVGVADAVAPTSADAAGEAVGGAIG